MEELFSGGISGAITDTGSAEAIAHAELYYEEIRHFTTDVEKISANTGYSREQILLVKHYLFLDKHLLGDEEPQFFDSCFEIAQSWQRLAFEKENIKEHDLLLLKHELREIELVNMGYTQLEAHNITNLVYNYTEACEEYYHNLQIKTSGRSVKGGAIGYLTYITH